MTFYKFLNIFIYLKTHKNLAHRGFSPKNRHLKLEVWAELSAVKKLDPTAGRGWSSLISTDRPAGLLSSTLSTFSQLFTASIENLFRKS
jgi:hypothetical protein